MDRQLLLFERLSLDEVKRGEVKIYRRIQVFRERRLLSMN